jgi:hypothetical protein
MSRASAAETARASSTASPGCTSQPVRNSSGITNGRPKACASAATRPDSGGSSDGTTTTAVIAAGISVQAPTKRQNASMPCRCAWRRTFRTYRRFARSSPANTNMRLRSPLATIRGAASTTLISVPGHDASRHQHAPRLWLHYPGMMKMSDTVGVRCRRTEARRVDRARDHRDPVGSELVAFYHRAGHGSRRRDHAVAARQR